MHVQAFMLADVARKYGGKISILGAGWNRITPKQFPHVQPAALIMAIEVDWTEMGRPHPFKITLVDEDMKSLAEVTGSFNVKRPTNLPAGSSTVVTEAPASQLKLDKAGRYLFILEIDESEQARLHFDVDEATG